MKDTGLRKQYLDAIDAGQSVRIGGSLYGSHNREDVPSEGDLIELSGKTNFDAAIASVRLQIESLSAQESELLAKQEKAIEAQKAQAKPGKVEKEPTKEPDAPKAAEPEPAKEKTAEAPKETKTAVKPKNS